METVSILFGYSFQLFWKLSLDWYPNQIETVSILEISFQINLFPLWILLAGIHSGLVTIGNTLWCRTVKQDWDIIKQKTFPEWKRQVTAAAEKKNITRLKKECETSSRGEAKKKTKTMFVLDKLDLPNYKRGPDSFILSHDYILYTRALIMGRYGMLKCTNNFSCGYGTKMCDTCNVLDDESHRINHCGKWQGANLHKNNSKIDYSEIFSDDTSKCLQIVKLILSLWDLENGKNEMRRIV